jgi:hypothetical protein
MISVLFSSKCRLLHNSTSFGSCIIHILSTGVQKFKKSSSTKGLKLNVLISYVSLPMVMTAVMVMKMSNERTKLRI